MIKVGEATLHSQSAFHGLPQIKPGAALIQAPGQLLGLRTDPGYDGSLEWAAATVNMAIELALRSEAHQLYISQEDYDTLKAAGCPFPDKFTTTVDREPE